MTLSGRPLVSVIIPVKDRHDLIVACLDGLAAQTYDPFEIVVVDDGSGDGSDDAAETHPGGGRPVTVIRLGDKGKGAVAARQAGVEEAVGEILAFTDSDCVPAPDWIERGVSAVESGKGVVQGRTEPVRARRPLERSMWVGRDDGLFPTCNVFYERTAFEDAGGFDLEGGVRLGFRPGSRARGLGMGEDTILGWKVRRARGGGFDPAVVVRHHVFPPDPRDTLSRSVQAGAFPALVREVPELRDTLLTRKLFLGTSRIPLYAAAGLLVVRRPKLALAATAVWGGRHWRRVAKAERGFGARLRSVGWLMAVDVVEAGSLVAGSVKARTAVL